MATWIGLKAGGTYDWNTAGNWSGGVPNSTTAVADFRADWTAFSTVNISTSVTTNQIFYEDTVSPYNGLGISVTAGRTLTLAGTTPYIDVGSNTGGLYVTAVIAGTTRWEKRNNGILILNAVNTFSGGVNVTGGQLLVANNSALGTGSVSLVTGTKLSSNSTTGYTLANALTLNGTMTLGDATNTGFLSFGGTTTLSAGSNALTTSADITFSGKLTGTGTLTKSGTAGLYLTGTTNDNNGAFTISAGTVYLANFAGSGGGTPNQLASVASISIGSNCSLQINGNTTYTIDRTISGSGLIYSRNTSASGIVLSGTLSSYIGSLRLYADSSEGATPTQKLTLTSATQFAFSNFYFQSGGGLSSLSQTLSYTGSGAVSNNSPLYVYAGSATPTAVFSNDTSVAGTLITQAAVVQNSNTVNATFQIAANNGPITFSQVISNPNGVLSISKTGTYAATLSNANTFSGTFSISAGTLNANSATALGADTSSGSVTSGATLSLGAALNYSTRNFTISGTGVSTGGALVHAFAGTAKIGAVTLGAATYVRGTVSGTSTLSSSIANGGFALTAGAASANTLTFTGGISGTGGLVVGNSASDTGKVALTTTNTYQGSTTLTYGTTQAGNVQAFGTVGAVTLGASGTLQTLTAGGQNGKLTVAGLTNSAGGTIRIGG